MIEGTVQREREGGRGGVLEPPAEERRRGEVYVHLKYGGRGRVDRAAAMLEPGLTYKREGLERERVLAPAPPSPRARATPRRRPPSSLRDPR